MSFIHNVLYQMSCYLQNILIYTIKNTTINWNAFH